VVRQFETPIGCEQFLVGPFLDNGATSMTVADVDDIAVTSLMSLLERQLDRLTEYAHDHGWSVENTYTDVGSGLNEDRRGLNSLLDDVQEADYGRILVTYEDRLTRFGFSYLERYFDCYGVTITIIEDETDKSAQEELVDDLIKLVASFSGKLYGMRSSEKQQVVNTVESAVKPDE